MGFGDNEPPAVRLKALPATLGIPNHIHILWITFVTWHFVHVRFSADGNSVVQVRLGEDQVQVHSGGLVGEWDLQSTIPGSHYSISMQACRQGGFGAFPAVCGPWSEPIEVRAVENMSSTSSFLVASGINMNQPVSIAALRPGVAPIRLKELLNGS
jgi:hypothetical protein